MTLFPAIRVERTTGRFSFDFELDAVAYGGLEVVKVAESSAGAASGDILILDQKPPRECLDTDYLLVEYGDKTLIRQKKNISAILRRTALHAVGDHERRSPVRVIGRLVGWIHAIMCMVLTAICGGGCKLLT